MYGCAAMGHGEQGDNLQVELGPAWDYGGSLPPYVGSFHEYHPSGDDIFTPPL